MGRLHYLRHSEQAQDEYGEAASRHGVSPLFENGREVDCERHLTVEFTERAIDFMGDGAQTGDGDPEGAGEDPFFCMVAYNAVHNFAWQLPQDELDARALPAHDDFDPAAAEYVDWYDGAISPRLEHGRDYYLAQLEIMDREIGRMLDHLEDTGQRESTLVVYLTDNGGSTCNYGDNAPLTGTKYSLFEGGVRVPFLVSRPGTVPSGEHSAALVSALDLLPTFAAAAGASLPVGTPVDGIDLRPVWEAAAERGEGERRVDGGRQEDGGRLLDGARQADGGHDALHFDTGFQWAVRTPDWKLRWVDASTGHREQLLAVEHTDIGIGLTLVPLGDGITDESAAADVSAEHPEIVAELTTLHEQWVAGLASA